MVVSCFFCQSMLSDFLESLLPEARGQEIRDHLQSCAECSRVERELKKTVEVSRRLPFAPLNHETALRITEACHAGTRKPVLGRVARWTALGLLPLVFVGLAALAFPRAFPWLDRFRDPNSEARFVRYFPLLNGAEEIVDEHANWLHVREPAMRSLWEEGGITPEEFEKSFTGKSVSGEETK